VTLAGAKIAALLEKNYELQGYRPVLVTTEPAGARVAFVPLDQRTGEPNPDAAGIIRPPETTPLTIDLKPGQYFVEAVLPGSGDTPDIAEVFRTVSKPGAKSSTLRLHPILIRPTVEIVADMVRVPIDEEIRRGNPLLPKVLYVDAKETAPDDLRTAKSETWVTDDGDSFVPFEGAVLCAEDFFKRLPSAAEYDAIVESAKDRQFTVAGTGEPALLEDLAGGLSEWTTSIYRYRGLHRGAGTTDNRRILKGYGNPDDFPGLPRMSDGQLVAPFVHEPSPMIGFRCVRSGAPRFVTQ